MTVSGAEWNEVHKRAPFFLLFLRSFYALKNLDCNGYQYTVLHAAIVMYVFAFPVSQGFTFPWHVFINVFNNYTCQNNNYIWILIKVHIISFCCFDFIHLQQVSRVIIWCFNVIDYLTSPSVFAFMASAADLFIAWGRGERWPYVSKCFAFGWYGWYSVKCLNLSSRAFWSKTPLWQLSVTAPTQKTFTVLTAESLTFLWLYVSGELWEVFLCIRIFTLNSFPSSICCLHGFWVKAYATAFKSLR